MRVGMRDVLPSLDAPPRVDRVRRLSDRERVVETAGAALLVVAVAVLNAVAPPGALDVTALDLAGLVLVYAACARVHLYVGGGSAVPTQLALVPMLFLLPPALVPVAVAAGLCCSTVLDIARGDTSPDRLLVSASDAWHAVGPALVFAVAGSPSPVASHWWV